MRILTFIFSLSFTAAAAFAQGTVTFANVGVGLNAPIFDVDGTTKLGSGVLAQLYVGSFPIESSLVAVPGPTTFLSNGGYFIGGTRTLPGFAAGTRPFFQVRVWGAAWGDSFEAAMAAGGGGGTSTVFQIGMPLGDSIAPTTPARLIGLTSFTAFIVPPIPEPSAIALGIIGGVALLLRRRGC